MSKAPSSAAPLDYAASHQTRSRRRIGWTIVLAAAVTAACFGALSPHLKEKLHQVLAIRAANQRVERCMSHSAPSTQKVVWDEDPNTYPGSVASPTGTSGYHRTDRGRSWTGMRYAAAADIPPEWAVYRAATPYFHNAPVVVFLGRRTDASGRAFVVCVDFETIGSPYGPHFCATLIEPGTWRTWPRHNGPFVCFEKPDLQDMRKPLRLYEGRADPADGSHFTIRYQFGQETGTFDGWLRSNPTGAAPSFDQWTVQMTRRPDAATQPAQ